MKKITLLSAVLVFASVSAQFTSPNNGTTYTLASLATAAPGSFDKVGSEYVMKQNVTISATDKLIADENTVIRVEPERTLYLFGTYLTTATDLTITATDADLAYNGIRVEDGATAEFRNTKFEYGGGIRVLGSNFLLDNCVVSKHKAGVSTSSALQFSKGTPIIKNSIFSENRKAAIGSAANATVSAWIENNVFDKNALDNANTPQINLGPAGADSTVILNNQIIGDRTKVMVGGISVSALLGGVNRFRIEGNFIKDNRYGFTTSGAQSSGIIKNNQFIDNNSQGNGNLGGSGISITSATNVIIRNNYIKGNLWGITYLSNGSANVGTENDHGNNVFSENNNGGSTYAMATSTASNVSAIGNCWIENHLATDEDVENVLQHQPDNASLGLFTFKPYKCALLATNEVQKTKISVFPNPSNGTFNVNTKSQGSYVIFDASGRSVGKGILNSGSSKISTNLKPGTYLLNVQVEGKNSVEKLIIK